MDVEIRPYHKGEGDEITNLLVRGFRGWPKFDLQGSSLDYWEWRHETDVFNKNSIVVASMDDRIIGCSHTDGYIMKILDSMVPVGTGNDLTVDQEYRRMGVSSRLHKERIPYRIEKGHEYALANPGPDFLKRSRKRVTDLFPLEVSQYVRIEDLQLHFEMMPSNGMKEKYGYIVLDKIQKIRNIGNQSTLSPRLAVEKVSSFPVEIDDFLEKMNEFIVFGIRLDRDFLNWRYCDPRGGDYSVNIVWESDEVVGYYVNRVNRYDPNYPKGYIIDFLNNPDRNDVTDLIARKSLEYFRLNDVNMVQVLLIRGNPGNKVFEKNGFLDRRQPYTILYEKYTEEDKIAKLDKASPEKIHYSYGDLDII